MELHWIHESPPSWDAEKQRIVGGAGPDIFERSLIETAHGSLLPGDWWRVMAGDVVVGFGWMDVTWGDAEMGLAVAPTAQRHGVGGFILDSLAAEASARGLHYLYNVVRDTHPSRAQVSAWLASRGFKASDDGKLLRSVVRRQSGSGRSLPGSHGHKRGAAAHPRSNA